MAEFHRLEAYAPASSHGKNIDVGTIECSFNSDVRPQGIIVGCVDGSIKYFDQQPNIHGYPEREQYYIECTCLIAYMLCFGNDHRNA